MKCENPQMNIWDSLGNTTADDDEMQKINFDFSNNGNSILATALRFRIISGWDNFICIYKISVIGLPVETLIDGSPALKRK